MAHDLCKTVVGQATRRAAPDLRTVKSVPSAEDPTRPAVLRTTDRKPPAEPELRRKSTGRAAEARPVHVRRRRRETIASQPHQRVINPPMHSSHGFRRESCYRQQPLETSDSASLLKRPTLPPTERAAVGRSSDSGSSRREAFRMPSHRHTVLSGKVLARLTCRRRRPAGSRRRRWVIRSIRRSMIAPRVEERREAVAVARDQVGCRAYRAGHRRPGRAGGFAPPTRFVRRAPTTPKRRVTPGLSAPSGRRS
jgi:hypothetical protein